jgi:hypothetical protein
LKIGFGSKLWNYKQPEREEGLCIKREKKGWKRGEGDKKEGKEKKGRDKFSTSCLIGLNKEQRKFEIHV